MGKPPDMATANPGIVAVSAPVPPQFADDPREVVATPTSHDLCGGDLSSPSTLTSASISPQTEIPANFPRNNRRPQDGDPLVGVDGVVADRAEGSSARVVDKSQVSQCCDLEQLTLALAK